MILETDQGGRICGSKDALTSPMQIYNSDSSNHVLGTVNHMKLLLRTCTLFLLVFTGLLLPSMVQADPPFLVKDINTERLSDEVCSDIVVMNDIAYFCAKTPQGGSVLWRSDGTEAGTAIVFPVGPRQLKVVDNTLYIAGWGDDDSGTTVSGLWRTDGTAAGTVFLKEMYIYSNIENLNGVVFFNAWEAQDGSELWRSDGTQAGTYRVSDILQGASIVTTFTHIRAIGNRLFFVANDGVHGNELWKSDGTSAGTLMVKDIAPGDTSGLDTKPSSLSVLNGKAIFFANDLTLGKQLWVSDGSGAGTIMLNVNWPGGAPSNPGGLTRELGSNVFFAESGDLWKTDGTAAGTVLLKAMQSNSLYAQYGAVTAGGKLYFSGSLNSSDPDGLWESDGTVTQAINAVYPGGYSGAIREIFVHEGKLYFEGGRLMALDLADRTIATMGSVNWSRYFSAAGLPGKILLRGGRHTIKDRLWRTDGSEAGTALVKQFLPESSSTGFGDAVQLGNALLFTANDGLSGYELWRTEGDEQSTTPIKDIAPGRARSNPKDMLSIGGVAFFTVDTNGFGRALWKSDGTEAGTMVVKESTTRTPVPANPANLSEMNGVLYFIAEGNRSGRELWRSDGTAAGTYLVKDIYPGIGNSAFSEDTIPLEKYNDFARIGDEIYFAATDGIHGEELWKSDGTESGTVQVKDINSRIVDGENLGSFPLGIILSNNILYFTAFTFSRGFELWRSDGTSAGTYMIKDIRPGFDGAGLPLGSEPIGLIDFNGKLAFFAYTDATGYELWISGGTSGTTHMVRDINETSTSSYGLNFGGNVGPLEIARVKDVVVIGRYMYFTATDSAHGHELWKTDGSYSGTTLVSDIYIGGGGIGGAGHGDPRDLTRVGDEFYFSANSAGAGRELWASDGSEANTRIIADILPGDGVASSPDRLIYAMNRLFFTADDGIKGRELWVLPIDSDGDGYSNDQDNCIFTPNPLQGNYDLDVLGDACDEDDDNDGYVDGVDAFPFDPTEWLDTDQDTLGNNIDPDDDNDGVLDSDPLTGLPLDNCPLVANPLQKDQNNDGVGDACSDMFTCFPVRASAGSLAVICF